MSRNSLITSDDFLGELGLYVSMFSEGCHKHTFCQFFRELFFLLQGLIFWFSHLVVGKNLELHVAGVDDFFLLGEG